MKAILLSIDLGPSWSRRKKNFSFFNNVRRFDTLYQLLYIYIYIYIQSPIGCFEVPHKRDPEGQLCYFTTIDYVDFSVAATKSTFINLHHSTCRIIKL
jgi:hypothetical protein